MSRIHRSILALALAVLTSGLSAAQDCQDYRANEIALYSSALLNNQYNHAMFVEGTRAYICSSTRLEILDISDPTDVTVAGSHYLGTFDDVAVQGDLACVTGLNPGVHFYDVSDPAAIQHISQLEITSYQNYPTNDVVSRNGYFYLARDVAGLGVIDASGAGFPDLGITVNVEPLVQHLAVDGDQLYSVGDGGSALCVFDLTDPAEPRLMATCAIPAGGSALTVRNGFVYIASANYGLMTVDVTNPAAPELVDQDAGTTGPPFNYIDYQTVAVDGHFLFAADRETYETEQVLDVFDLSDPADPVFAGRKATGDELIALHARDGYLLGAKNYNGYAVLDVSQPKSTVPVGRRVVGGEIHDSVQRGEYLFQARGAGGFSIHRASNLWVISSTVLPGDVLGVALQEDLAYVAMDDAGLVIVDIGNYVQPVLRDDIDTPGHARQVALYSNEHGTVALVADTEYDLVAYDVTDPDWIRPKGVTYFPGQVNDVEVKDGYVLAADDSGFLQVADASVFPDPVQPVASLEVPGHPTRLFLDGDVLYMGGGGHITAVDVSDPALPLLLGSLETAGSGRGLLVKEGVAYCAGEAGMMDVVRVQDPAAMEHVAAFAALTELGTLFQADQILYLASVEGYLLEMPWQCLAAAPVPDGVPGGAAANLGQAYPNPFNPRTSISFELMEPGRVDLTIYDVAGRLVRRLIAGEMRGNGQHVAVWDGTDEAGRAAASGVYLYRMTAGQVEETRRMALVR